MKGHKINREGDKAGEDVDDQTTIAAAVEGESKQSSHGEFLRVGPTVEKVNEYRLSGLFLFLYSNERRQSHSNNNQ